MQKVPSVILMLFLILFFVLGAKMALRVSLPWIRPISGSLAAAIESA